MGVIQRIKKPTTRKGKLYLQKKEPKFVEDAKQTIFIRGRKTPDSLMSCIKDLYSFKKPDAIMYGKKNDILPFENSEPIEKLCRKFGASLFVFASSNKKRPNNIILGRTYDNQLLDMIELGVSSYKSIHDFATEKITTGLKPCLLFAGEGFETKPELIRLKNLFTDLFQREPVKAVRLQGLEHAIMFTATEDAVLFRSYRILMKKSGSDLPRVELEEIGPSIDFKLRRTKLASDDLFKTACKKPKELKVKTKSIKTNVFGTKEARVHVGKQHIRRIQTARMKGLRRGPTDRRKGGKNKAAAKNNK